MLSIDINLIHYFLGLHMESSLAKLSSQLISVWRHIRALKSTKAGDQKKNLLKGQVPRIKILRTYLSIFCQNYRVPQRKLKLEVFCNEYSQGMHALFFRILIILKKGQLSRQPLQKYCHF